MASNIPIPKFGSFRPKPKEPVETRPPKDELKAARPHRSERSSRPDKSHRSEKPSSEKRQKSPEHEKRHSDSYFSDRRGDPDILKYGSINRYDIPDYRRHGYGYVLGLSTDKKIDRERSTDKYLYTTDASRHRKQRLLTGKHAARESQRTLRLVKASHAQNELDNDFIFLSTGKRKRDDSEERSDVDYRGLERFRTSAEPPDPDLKSDSESDIDNADSEVTQRNASLIRQTREDPNDLQAWLDLVDHQEAMLKLNRSSTDLSASDKRSLAEVRVSTYEHALDKIGGLLHPQITLYLGLMDEALKCWDGEKLASKWTDLLRKYPNSADVALKYLDFVQSRFSTFTYENCRSVFLRCMRDLRSGASIIPRETSSPILVRITSMIQQAGYQELALAIWQALLEYEFLKPSASTGAGHEENIRSFEEFWDSEVARIGEVGAKGWAHFNPDDAVPLVAGTIPLEEPQPSSDVFEDFEKREAENMKKLRYPGRTTDDVGEDDAFHLVLFSDIEEYLQTFTGTIFSTDVIEAFLCFCRLPPLPLWPGSSRQHGWHDPFLQSQSTSVSARNPHPGNFTDALVKFLEFPVRGFQTTLELLCDQAFPDTLDIVDADFVHRVLKLVITGDLIDESICVYLLAFELKYFPSEVFRAAKQLLKERSSSLPLYNIYGLVESRRGNSKKADHVFSTALSMRKGEDSRLRTEDMMLFSSWIWEALRRGEKKEALWRFAYPNGQILKGHDTQDGLPDHAARLRAWRTLSDSRDHAMATIHYQAAVLSTSLLALLAYLSGGEKPEDALEIHRALESWHEKRGLAQSFQAELHAQLIAEFLAYHASTAPIVRPGLLRTTLEPLVTRFPNNSILLSLFAANEARFAIDDRVRNVVHQTILSNPKSSGIVSWAFAINYEILRGEIAGSTSHSIRALYKKAEDDVSAHCPALWKNHVLFELEEARKEKDKRPAKEPRKDGKKRKDETRVEEAYRRVKETFFRGTTMLPWCKDYMMLAFTHLKDEFLSAEELRRVYNVMVEKELRLYVDLDTTAT